MLFLCPNHPALVEWVFSPDTGNAPYILNYDLFARNLIDDGTYEVKVYALYGSGSCPLQNAVTIFEPDITTAVVANNSYVFNYGLPVDSCLGVRAVITRISDSKVVQDIITYIDNI